jgi:hypothetical protein
MTSIIQLLDAAPGPAPNDLAIAWNRRIEASLSAGPVEWLAAARAESFTVSRQWALLSWVEESASLLVREGRPETLELSAFALSLLEWGQLDWRDRALVGSLLRRGSDLAGVSFAGLIDAGSQRAGAAGEACSRWLSQVSATTPQTHVELNEGSAFRFMRKPSDIDIAELERWLEE